MIKELPKTTTEPYLAQFDTFVQEQAGDEPSWITSLRREALSRFREVGFPTRHDEEWQYTPITSLVETVFERAKTGSITLTAQDVVSVPFGNLPGNRLVFVNGVFAPDLSRLNALPNGVTVSNMATALQSTDSTLEPHLANYARMETNVFVALNTAFFEDGAFIHIPRNAIVEDPIQLLYIATQTDASTFSSPRTLIVAEANSQASFFETYVGMGEGLTFTNAVTEIVLAENAHIDHCKVTKETEKAYHIATMQVQLARNSVFTSQNITLGGALVRNDHNAYLGAEGGECTLNGLYMAKDRQVVDNHTAIDHAMPHCNSHEIYKGILDDRARGVFNGKIFVREDAQKTDAKQTNQTLLLSKEATINTKPQLEIFADDVKCTHGATIGQLEAEAMFYLRSRGIGVEQARALLLFAFASDIIDRVKVEALRTEIHNYLFTGLPQEVSAGEV